MWTNPRTFASQRIQPGAGFTLIEVLVVISIVAILVSILMPSLRAARETSRAAVCLSNERQYGVIFTAYLHDYEEYFPLYSYAGYPDMPANSRWAGVLWKHRYLTGNQMFLCPAFGQAVRPTINLIHSATPTDSNEFNYIHYGYNYLHLGAIYRSISASSPQWPNRWKQSTKIKDIRKTSQTLMVGDSLSFTGMPAGESKGSQVLLDNRTDADINLTGYPHARHQQGVNMLWVDGHAGTVKTQGVDPLRDAWNSDALGDYTLKPNLWDRY